MELKRIFLCYKAILLWYFLASACSIALAQDSTLSPPYRQDKRTYIDWVSQFPAGPAEKVAPSFTQRITNFFFGKKELVLSKPVSVLAENSDNIWVLDQGNGTIVQINSIHGDLKQLQNKKLVSGVGLSSDEINFTSLVGICSLPSGELLFTDSRQNKIFHISPDKKQIRILNDSLFLQQPTGIAYSKKNKEIWVVETKAHRISVLNNKGERLRTIGGRGVAAGEFNYPTYIWIDGDGNVYVVDAMNFRVQVFDKNGAFVSMFGEVGDASGYMASPKGIATDSYGNIYLADALFHTVQIFDKNGNYLHKFGEQGRDKRQFWMPSGIYIDASDQVYVADSYNSRIQVFQLINGDIK